METLISSSTIKTPRISGVSKLTTRGNAMLDSNDRTKINHGKIATICVVAMLGIIILGYATQPQAEEITKMVTYIFSNQLQVYWYVVQVCLLY